MRIDVNRKTAIIIGAGPAGLTAAYELLEKTDIKPIIYEMSNDIGGISKTIAYKDNRMDIGGHRFFSKSGKVMRWWTNILPLQDISSHDPETTDRVMLIRKRISRILFRRKFFDYPIMLNFKTFTNLGLMRTCRSALSYIRVRLFPIKETRSLEDFFINRFGRELYEVFFKDYTQKVWGVPCSEISPEWGAQRIKGLSIAKAVSHAVRYIFFKDSSIYQKGTETSLIEQFMYPKYGPGQMWEEVARIVEERGGEIHLLHEAIGFVHRQGRIEEVVVRDESNKNTLAIKGDYFFSTMPVKDLIAALGDDVPPEVSSIARGLKYRDFISVGLLLKELRLDAGSRKRKSQDIVPDNWIYVQEKDVKVCRLQIFNNWSPYLVQDEKTVWIGLEYMCNEGDDLWEKSDGDLLRLAVAELVKIGAVAEKDILDGLVIRMPKVYPAYFGSYDQFHVIRAFTDGFENLFLIGRNGMHRYNNQDHSMLSAMAAVDNILNNVRSKDNIWSVNAEEEYHEAK